MQKNLLLIIVALLGSTSIRSLGPALIATTQRQIVALCDQSSEQNILDSLPRYLEILKENNTNLNYQDGYGYTALHYAVFHNHPEVAKQLLSYGANLHIEDNLGYTPITIPCQQSFLAAQNVVVHHQKNNSIFKWGTVGIVSSVLLSLVYWWYFYPAIPVENPSSIISIREIDNDIQA